MFYRVAAFFKKKSENDVFAFKISYEDGVNPLYNGNISETFWRTESDDILRKYEYHYDDLNRLLEANYFKPEQVTAPNNYMEYLKYDKNGNITSLKRNGDLDSNGMMPEHLIDDLIYAYDPQKPNQLMKVTDDSTSPQGFKDGTNTGDDYAYDANGNMTSDQNKGIDDIYYNHLNLPTKIIFGDGNQISYLYNATGQKVSKKVEADAITTIDYLSGFQYNNAKLNFFPHAEGYVNVTYMRNGPSFNYVFNYTDHLGNIRLSYGVDPHPTSGVIKIMEENHYYPFGLKHTNYNSGNKKYFADFEGFDLGMVALRSPISSLPTFDYTDYKYKYNGKEWQDELGLNMYDYGARNYDPALGRWMNIDPLADDFKQVGTSPYTFVANNPIQYNDPTGLIWEDPKQAEKLNNSVNNRIESIKNNTSKLEKEISSGKGKFLFFSYNLSEKQIVNKQEKISENSQKIELLNQSLSDIEAIGNAEETYRLGKPSVIDGSHRVVKGSDGIITIEGSNTGLHLHEIRHVGQSIEAGGVRFNKDGSLLNAGTTLMEARNNEVNAYQVQYSFDGSYPAGASSLKDINSRTLMDIKRGDNSPVYEKLKDKK